MNGTKMKGCEPSLTERTAAAKWLGERVMPPAKQATTAIPDGADLSEPGNAARAVMRAVAAGEITAREATELLTALRHADHEQYEELSKGDFLASIARTSIEEQLTE